MIQGSQPLPSMASRVFETGIICLFLAPWFLLGGALILVGIHAIAQPAGFGDLWICLPPGLLTCGVFGYIAFRYFYTMPRLTVMQFRYDAGSLEFWTKATHWQIRQASEIKSVREWRGRRRLAGWSLVFRDHQRVYLSATALNARTLIEQLQEDLAETATVFT